MPKLHIVTVTTLTRNEISGWALNCGPDEISLLIACCVTHSAHIHKKITNAHLGWIASKFRIMSIQWSMLHNKFRLTTKKCNEFSVKKCPGIIQIWWLIFNLLACPSLKYPLQQWQFVKASGKVLNGELNFPDEREWYVMQFSTFLRVIYTPTPPLL